MAGLAIFKDGMVFKIRDGIGRYEVYENDGVLIIERYSGKNTLMYREIIPKKGLVIYSPDGKVVDTNQDESKVSRLIVYYPGFRNKDLFFMKEEKYVDYFYIFNELNYAKVLVVDEEDLNEFFQDFEYVYRAANRISFGGKVFKKDGVGYALIDKYGRLYDGLVIKGKEAVLEEWLKENNIEIYK